MATAARIRSMKKIILGGAVASLCLAGGVFAYRVSMTRADCPGKMVCPITGNVICADQCPLDEQMPAPTPSCCKTAKP